MDTEQSAADEDLARRVFDIIAKSQRRDPASVNIESSFEELGVDSMDAVNIVFGLESEFSIDIPDDKVRTIRSVRDMVEGVRALVASSGAGGAADVAG